MTINSGVERPALDFLTFLRYIHNHMYRTIEKEDSTAAIIDIARTDSHHFLNLINEEFSYFLPLEEFHRNGRPNALANIVNLSYDNIFTNLKWLQRHAEAKTTPYDIMIGVCRMVLEAEANLYYIIESKNARRLANKFLSSMKEVQNCQNICEFEEKMSSINFCKIAKFDDSTTTDRIQSLLNASFANFPRWAANNCNFFVHNSVYGMHTAAFFKDNPDLKALPLLLTYDSTRILPCIFLKQNFYPNLRNASILILMEILGTYAARDSEMSRAFKRIWDKKDKKQ